MNYRHILEYVGYLTTQLMTELVLTKKQVEAESLSELVDFIGNIRWHVITIDDIENVKRRVMKHPHWFDHVASVAGDLQMWMESEPEIATTDYTALMAKAFNPFSARDAVELPELARTLRDEPWLRTIFYMSRANLNALLADLVVQARQKK